MPGRSSRDTGDQLNTSETSDDNIGRSRRRSNKKYVDDFNDIDNSQCQSFNAGPAPEHNRSDVSQNNSAQSSISTPPSCRIYPDLSTDYGFTTHRSSSLSLSHVKSNLYPILLESADQSTKQRGRHQDVHQRCSDNDNSFCFESLNSSKSKATIQTQEECSSSSGMSLVVAVPIFIGVFIVILCFLLLSPQQVSKTGLSPFQQFLHDVDNLQDKFPDQRQQLWKTFKASAKHILNSTDSSYPSVILMASDIHSADLASCLAKKLASSFESSQGLVPGHAVVDVESFRNLDEKTQKLKLDEKLYSALQSQGMKSFVIKNLQFLSAEAALLLHGYCDGDNAPYKDVMLVLSLQVDPRDSVLDPDMPSGVEFYLSRLWERGLDSDKVAALMSRVANNIVVVSQEASDQWIQQC